MHTGTHERAGPGQREGAGLWSRLAACEASWLEQRQEVRIPEQGALPPPDVPPGTQFSKSFSHVSPGDESLGGALALRACLATPLTARPDQSGAVPSWETACVLRHLHTGPAPAALATPQGHSAGEAQCHWLGALARSRHTAARPPILHTSPDKVQTKKEARPKGYQSRDKTNTPVPPRAGPTQSLQRPDAGTVSQDVLFPRLLTASARRNLRPAHVRTHACTQAHVALALPSAQSCSPLDLTDLTSPPVKSEGGTSQGESSRCRWVTQGGSPKVGHPSLPWNPKSHFSCSAIWSTGGGKTELDLNPDPTDDTPVTLTFLHYKTVTAPSSYSGHLGLVHKAHSRRSARGQHIVGVQ